MTSIWQLPVLIGLSLAINTMTFAQENHPEEELQPVALGEHAPDFELDTFDDKTVVLSERFADDGRPVVLLFSRANW